MILRLAGTLVVCDRKEAGDKFYQNFEFALMRCEEIAVIYLAWGKESKLALHPSSDSNGMYNHCVV